MQIEIAYATPGEQTLLRITVPAGTELAAAVEQSGILAHHPEIDWQVAAVGVFGRKRGRETLLRDGDRVEIYRPLRVDPKTRRRERAGS